MEVVCWRAELGSGEWDELICAERRRKLNVERNTTRSEMRLVDKFVCGVAVECFILGTEYSGVITNIHSDQELQINYSRYTR